MYRLEADDQVLGEFDQAPKLIDAYKKHRHSKPVVKKMVQGNWVSVPFKLKGDADVFIQKDVRDRRSQRPRVSG